MPGRPPAVERTVAQVVPVHSRPRFDLRTERWIPVRTGTGPEMLGVGEVFARAHEIDGLAIPDPLERYAMHRFLIALSYRMVGLVPDHDWAAVTRGPAPLPAEAVDGLLDSIRPWSHLFDPDRPFLQNPALRERVTSTSKTADDSKALAEVTHPYSVLLAHVPAKSNVVWRYDKEAALAAGLSFPEAARALVTRQFASTSGNEAALDVGKLSYGTPLMSYIAPHTATRIVRIGRTLAATLLANHLADFDPTGPFCWENPDPTHVEESLWRYTAAGGAVYLTEPADDRVRFLLRSPQPGAPQLWKAALEAVRADEPHTIRVTKRDGGVTHVTGDHGQTRTRFACTVHRRLLEAGGDALPGVNRAGSLRFRTRTDVEATLVSFAGAMGSFKVEEASVLHAPSGMLDLEPTQRASFVTLANRVTGTRDSVSSRLGHWCAIACFGDDPNPSEAAALKAKVSHALWSATDRMLAVALEAVIGGASVVDVDTDDWRNEIAAAALAVFDDITHPYTQTGPGAVRAAKARIAVRSRVKEALT